MQSSFSLQENQEMTWQECAPEKDKIMMFRGSTLEDYQMISELGDGTYGNVNKYRHIETGEVVAIKTFKFPVRLSSIQLFM